MRHAQRSSPTPCNLAGLKSRETCFPACPRVVRPLPPEKLELYRDAGSPALPPTRLSSSFSPRRHTIRKIMTPETVLKVRSYELDSYGHVNHAVYLNYFEKARFDTLDSYGITRRKMLDNGLKIYVVRLEIDYLSQVFFEDTLQIKTVLEKLKRTSLTFCQEARTESSERDGKSVLVAKARVVAVWVSKDGSPCRMPTEITEQYSREVLGATEGSKTRVRR